MQTASTRPHSRVPHGTLTGVVLTAFSAVGFAFKGVFAKFLYAAGWHYEAVITARAVLALPLIAVWTLWRGGPRSVLRAPAGAVLGSVGAGLLCYYLGALLDFYALTTIDVGVERVLLFSYPSMVVLLYAILYRSWPNPRVLIALAVTFAGILMVVTGFDLGVLRGNLAGAGLVLACALTFAIYYLAGDRWTRAIGSAAFTLFAQAASAVALVGHFLASHAVLPSHVTGYQAAQLGGLVVFATVLPMLAMAEGVRLIGAERASVVSTVGPPTTIILGAWLLGEHLRAAQWAGVACIVAGIFIMEVARRKPQPAAAPGP